MVGYKELNKSIQPSISRLHSGLDKLEFLQGHENQEIYQKAFDLIERYFNTDDEDPSLAPAVDLQQQQFLFQQCEAPMDGFQL